MIIDPRVGFWLSIVLTVLGAFTALSADQTTLLFGNAHTAQVVVTWIGVVLTIGNALNAALHAIPESQPDTKAQSEKFLLGPTVK